MTKLHFSMIVSTKRDFNSLKPLFETTDKNTELIITDANYNEETKSFLKKQKGFEKIVYLPIKTSPFKFQRNFAQGLNTALSFCEHGWIIRMDDNLELKSDFFEISRANVDSFKDNIGSEKFAIIGQKLWETQKHQKWNDYYIPNEPSRYIPIDNPQFTFSFGLYPIDLIYTLNGYDERYDIGHGYEDIQFLHRIIRSGYSVFYDRYLMGYSHTHETQKYSMPITKMLYELEMIEIECGKIHAFNSFNFYQSQVHNLAHREDFVI